LKAAIGGRLEYRPLDRRDGGGERSAEGQLPALLVSAAIISLVERTPDQKPPARPQRPDVIELEDADPCIGEIPDWKMRPLKSDVVALFGEKLNC
jgi:hypothetical protein